MPIYHVSVGFAQGGDGDVETRADTVFKKMTGNVNFPDPDVPLADLNTALLAFRKGRADAANVGSTLTLIKNNLKAALILLLRRQAIYVEEVANNNPEIMASSGFDYYTASNTQSELDQTVILSAANVATTQLLIRLLSVINAKSYEIEISTDGITWVHIKTSTKARSILLENLKPGTLYYIRARAVGGSTDYGPWSEIIQHMAT